MLLLWCNAVLNRNVTITLNSDVVLDTEFTIAITIFKKYVKNKKLPPKFLFVTFVIILNDWQHSKFNSTIFM